MADQATQTTGSGAGAPRPGSQDGPLIPSQTLVKERIDALREAIRRSQFLFITLILFSALLALPLGLLRYGYDRRNATVLATALVDARQQDAVEAVLSVGAVHALPTTGSGSAPLDSNAPAENPNPTVDPDPRESLCQLLEQGLPGMAGPLTATESHEARSVRWRFCATVAERRINYILDRRWGADTLTMPLIPVRVSSSDAATFGGLALAVLLAVFIAASRRELHCMYDNVSVRSIKGGQQARVRLRSPLLTLGEHYVVFESAKQRFVFVTSTRDDRIARFTLLALWAPTVVLALDLVTSVVSVVTANETLGQVLGSDVPRWFTQIAVLGLVLWLNYRVHRLQTAIQVTLRAWSRLMRTVVFDRLTGGTEHAWFVPERGGQFPPVTLSLVGVTNARPSSESDANDLREEEEEYT